MEIADSQNYSRKVKWWKILELESSRTLLIYFYTKNIFVKK